MKNDFIRNKNIKNEPKKAVKKTFSFYALVFALLFMFFGSILGTVAFVRTSVSESSTNIAYADSVDDYWVYQGSDLFFPLNEYSRTSTVNGPYIQDIVSSPRYYIDFLSLGFKLEKRYAKNYIGDYFASNVPVLSFDWYAYAGALNNISLSLFRPYIISSTVGQAQIIYSSENDTRYFGGAYNPSDMSTNLPNQTYYDNDTIIKSRYTFGFNDSSSSNNRFYGNILTETTYGFNCNVQKVEIYSSTPTFNGAIASFSNFIKYTDNNNRTFLIEMPLFVTTGSSGTTNFPAVGAYKLETRTYYTQGGFSGEINEQLKQQASVITQRYEDEIQALKIQYQNQLQDAVSTARQQGYNEGISNNNTTFLSLFGALFDAPIQALSGLLNFDVLGFNLWNFFTAVITIGIVIFVVRLFL